MAHAGQYSVSFCVERFLDFRLVMKKDDRVILHVCDFIFGQKQPEGFWGLIK